MGPSPFLVKQVVPVVESAQKLSFKSRLKKKNFGEGKIMVVFFSLSPLNIYRKKEKKVTVHVVDLFWKWMEPRDTLNTTVSAAAALLLAALSQSSQPGTSSSSSSSEYQNMPHSTFTFYLPSDHQLSSHFLKKFSQAFFFYLKKWRGKKIFFLSFCALNQKSAAYQRQSVRLLLVVVVVDDGLAFKMVL